MRRRNPLHHASAILAAMVFSSCFVGCFTETGNPGSDNETAVNAKFFIDYDTPAPGLIKSAAAASDPVIHVTSFCMTVEDAEFDTDLGDTDFVIADPLRCVDFTKPETLLWIKPEALSAAAWRIFHFNFQIPASVDPTADTVDYAAFNDPGFIKGDITYDGGRRTNFLFQMPKLNYFGLYYVDSTMVKMKTQAGWNIPIALQAERLLRGIKVDTLPIALDKNGIPFALITQKKSGGVWGLMRNNFYRSFGVDSIEVEGYTIRK